MPRKNSHAKLCEFLGGRRQSPALLQTSFDCAEKYAIDQIAKRDDQNHDGDDLAHVVEVATHHQQLAQAKSNEDHLSRNQRAPGKGPALLQTGDNVRQAGGKSDMPKQTYSACAQVTSSHVVNLRELLATRFHANGDR